MTDKPGSVLGNHSSRPTIARWLKLSTRSRRGPRRNFKSRGILFEIAPSGVYRATNYY